VWNSNKALPVGRRDIILIQSIYYFITALWPIVSVGTFMMVTGPKTDVWLVKTVAVMILAIAITLFFGALRASLSRDVCTLALLASLGLTTIDIYYSLSGTIPAIYLADVPPEIVFAIAALALWPRTTE